jgi:hypothetical protein
MVLFSLNSATDGTVTWFTACHAHGVIDPTLEPANHDEALGIPL